MQTTWLMPKGATAANVVYWIDWAIRNSANQRLENVVINCHGRGGFLGVGGRNTGFGIEGTKLFYKFKGKNAIGTIWLVACDVAGGDGLGTTFCTALAKATDSKVIAGMGTQSVEGMFDFFRPNECIDEFEGGAYYYKEGEMGTWNSSFGKEY
jgi:hypothetical protein